MKLQSGSVLPSGLLSNDTASAMSAFAKTHANYPLRAGIIVKSYAPEDKNNQSKLAMEYDVIVLEQDNNRAITPITYKNCLSTDGLGSIADFFEVRLRTQKNRKGRSQGKEPRDQDGALVLLLCLDGSSEKAVIIGGLTHPRRKSKIKGQEKTLAGEFNGLSIAVNDDGSANLTFKGATDHEGKPTDSSQGNTTIDIESDGSVQFKNAGVTQRMEKAGAYLLSAEKTATITAKDSVAIKSGNEVSIESAAATNVKVGANFLAEISGSATVMAQMVLVEAQTGLTLKGSQITIESGSVANFKGAQINLDALVFAGGAGGQPALLPSTFFIGADHTGFPVISLPIGPFATKVFIV